MYSVKITAAAKMIVQSDSSEMLAVDFDVLNGEEVIAHYSHGFPLSTKSDEVHAYLKTFVDTYTANAARAEENAARDAEHAIADETIEAIVGVEIKN